jgi:hypothetical protein
MSSTVTTTTISTITTATYWEVGHMLPLVAMLLLVVALLARELSGSIRGDMSRRVSRGVDIAMMPLMITFGVVLYLGTAAAG